MRIAIIISLVVSSWLSTAVAQSQQRPSAMIDVTLTGEGHLSSRCETANGKSVCDAIVELVRGQEKVAWATSGSDGSFVLRDISPGTYRLQCGDCDRSIRVWSQSTAPPAARGPIVIVVGVADQPFPYDDVFSRWATGQSSTIEEEPVLPLQIVEGDTQRTAADVSQQAEVAWELDPPEADDAMREADVRLPANKNLQPTDVQQESGGSQDLVEVSSSVIDAGPDSVINAEPESVSAESSDRNAHAHHTVESNDSDAPFDPFAGMAFDAPQATDPQFVNTSLQAPATPASQPVAESGAAPVVESVPLEVPPSGDVRYIRCNVGPTVGDVVVTSFGIAGITMGIVAIHKYDNRRIRRVVSP